MGLKIRIFKTVKMFKLYVIFKKIIFSLKSAAK